MDNAVEACSKVPEEQRFVKKMCIRDSIEAMNTYFKEKQDGRFVHYESSFYDRNYEETISDVESRMYAVSYTHLDVYKRQLLLCIGLCAGLLISPAHYGGCDLKSAG